MSNAHIPVPDAAGFEFIELGRTFNAFSDYIGDNDELDVASVFHLASDITWETLLRQYRVVILSEAGSGKTAEIRSAANKVRADGEAAFFLRLENVSGNFEDAFEVGTFAEFEVWLASNTEGWLFLDSVDEARLKSPNDFDLAIRKLGRILTLAMARTHIVITGRIAAWRPKSDLAICSANLPYLMPSISEQSSVDDDDAFVVEQADTKPSKDKASIFKAYALADLGEKQIARFAQARGVADTKALLDAVARADAWTFTTRPQDLEEVVAFWIEQKRIGSRLEIIKSSIDRRLSERDPTRALLQPMTLEQARNGARVIAACTTLMQEQVIRVPDAISTAAGIPIQSMLPDWTEKDQSTLLARPIFDEAIYGTVRFHHRSVREYLAAEWFADLLKRDTSRRSIEGLFFREQYGREIVVPALRPILPWLVLMDSHVRERVSSLAPEIFFEGGDPSQLPVEMRRQILQDVCKQMASGDAGRSMRDYAAVERFANDDLASEVRALLSVYSRNDDLTAFLLRMVWLGQLREALPEVLREARGNGRSHYTRTTAIRALLAIGSDTDKLLVREEFLNEGDDLDREWLADLIEGLGATEQTTAWLVAAVTKVEAKERYSVDHLTDRVSEFVASASAPLLDKCVTAFNLLLSIPPYIEGRYCEVSQRHQWLLVPAAKAVERLIQLRDNAALSENALDILHKIATVRGYGADELREIKQDFSKHVPEWPELNRALFWHEVACERRRLDEKSGEVLTEHRRVAILGSFAKFGPADFDYVAEQIGVRSLDDDRLVALSLAFTLYVQADRLAAQRKTLKKITESQPLLSARLASYLTPPAQPAEQRRWKQTQRGWEKRAEEQSQKEEARHADWKKYLGSKLYEEQAWLDANPGKLTNALLYLLDQTRKNEPHSGRWTKYNWQELAADYGQPVAKFFRDATVKFWRQYIPKIRSEGAPLNSTPHAVIIGLTGLEIEATEVEDWASQLSPADVDNAFRYASFELNGFPVWFPHLFEAHPEKVLEFFLQEITFELSIDVGEGSTNYILSDLSWTGKWAWDALAPKLVKLLASSEPGNLEHLDHLLKILQGSSLSSAVLAELAAQKCKTLIDPMHHARWFAVWTGVEPALAIPALRAHFKLIESDQGKTDFAMIYATHLWGGRRSEGTGVREAFKTPAYLKSLYLLLHEHIRRKEDIERGGKGVFSPGLRDDAQDSRNSIFDALNKIPGKEAFLALVEISQSHPEEEARPWISRLALVKAEQDGDMQPWTAQQVRHFGDKLERTPRTHRELAELAVFRLLDLKDDLEDGDSSAAKILRLAPLETDIRTYLGDVLRKQANGRYIIPQEEELADAKRIDLRFHGVGFDGPVPGELKLAERWTGPKLLERLENQLCGDYLRDPRSSRGLFVLVYRGDENKQEWIMPGSEGAVDFAGLVKALAMRWDEISSKFPSVEDVTVVGIDLTSRDR